MAINPNYMVIVQQSPKPGDSAGGISVVGSLPDSFTFDTRSEYQAPFSQGMGGGSGLSTLAKFGGIRLVSQALTAQIWQGSAETELGLELEFHAENSPITDVRDPILDLMRLTTASTGQGTGMLQSPGPQLDLALTAQIGREAASQLTNSAVQIGSAVLDTAKSFLPGKLNSETANRNSNSVANAPPSNGGLGQARYWKDRVRNQISIRIGRYAFFDSVVITNVQKTYQSQIDDRTGLPMYAKVSIQFRPLFQLVQADLDQIFALQR